MAEAEAKSDQSESMEDILQSIKRIIEDDGAPEAKNAAGESDVLDLTQIVAEGPPAAAKAPPPPAPPSMVPPPPAEDVVKSIDAMFAEEKKPVAAQTATPAPKPVKMEDGLVSDEAAQAALAALKPIAESSHKDFSLPHIPSAQLRGGNTVEDLILEALKPMLKSWLDEHLPTIVQKIVEKEVKRIVAFHQD